MNNKNIVIAVVVILIIIIGGVYFARTSHAPTVASVPAKTVPDLSQTYSNTAKGFSIKYPAGFTADNTYTYQELGPGKDISGVKFTIPRATAAGTNLGSDSYISVEEIPKAAGKTQSCTANLFLDVTAAHTLVDGSTTYSVAASTGAAAGNRYEERVFAIPGASSCLAIRYFIHYSVFENYPAGTIKPFDEQALLGQFDAIRHTLVINQ